MLWPYLSLGLLSVLCPLVFPLKICKRIYKLFQRATYSNHFTPFDCIIIIIIIIIIS
jgi:hypothetical protein